MNCYQDCRLVKAQPTDLATVRQILAACNLPAFDISEELLQHFFILYKDDLPVGSIGLEIYDNHGLLRSLAVRKQFRGNGFGRYLVKQLEKYAADKSVNHLYLLTTTAKDFFEKAGYSPIGRSNIPSAVKRSKEFSTICPSSAPAMVKHLE